MDQERLYGGEEKDYEDEAYDSRKEQRTWIAELTAAKKELESFHEEARNVVDVYLDKRLPRAKKARKFNLFNTNVSILQSALFARIPKPDVKRRFSDPSDQVGRVAAQIVQRALITETEADSDFRSAAKDIIKDRLVAGLGCAWVRYDPVTEEPAQITDNVSQELSELPGASPIITEERTPIDWVHWEDIRWSPARSWSEVRWVARRAYLTEDELEEQFGEDVAYKLCYDEDKYGGSGNTRNEQDQNKPQNNTEKTAEVWEVWCKTSKKVYFIAEGLDEPLKVMDDPLGLPTFFPCPKFLLGTNSTSNLVPMPDYKLVQDQYEELNTINARISNLIRACKVAGAYNKEFPQLENIFKSPETTLVPVEKWDMWGQNGGVRGAIDFVPVEQIVGVIGQLNQAREAIKQQIYELTGISDIVRGATSPYETAAAQGMKMQNASLRLNALQQEVAEFFGDLMRLKAFLMVKFYRPETLVKRAGPMNQYDAQFIPSALGLLKDEYLSYINIDVSVDSLQMPNWAAEKQERAEFITAMSNLLRESVPAAQQMPQLGPLLLQLTKFGVSSFRGAAQIEGFVDEQLNQIFTPQQQGPKPEDQAAQQAQAEAAARAQAEQARFQLESSKVQGQLSLDQQRTQIDAELKARELALEEQTKQAELALEQQRLALEQQRVALDAARLKLEEAKLNQEGVDTTDVDLPLGDATPKQRVSKEEMLMMLQGMMETMQQNNAQMLGAFTSALNQLVNTPQPPAQIVLQKDANGRIIGGSIQ